MSPLHSMALGLALLVPTTDPLPIPVSDLPRLEMMLHDHQHPRLQSQAALLLVQSNSREAESLVRRELKQTNDPDVYQALTAALCLERDARFLDELWGRMRGGSPALRQATADVLAEMADPSVVRRLRELVDDSQAEAALRRTALNTLGRTGRKEAVAALLEQLGGSDEGMRATAAETLNAVTGLQYGPDLNRWRQWWQRYKEQSGEQWLQDRLSYESSRAHRFQGELDRARAQIVSLHQQLFTRMPAADRPGHITLLIDNEDPAVRSLAVGWCVELWPGADQPGQRGLADLLIRASHDGDQEVQRNAVLALGRINDPRVDQRLRSLLEASPARIRAAAARSLTQRVAGSGPEAALRQKQVVSLLQKALDDPALEVVVEAAENLGTLGVPEAGSVLILLLRHPMGQVRQTAALALERVADPTVVGALTDALEDSLATVRFSLVGAVVHAMRDRSAMTDEQKRKVLARLEDLLVRDQDPGVRSRAATALGECGSEVQLQILWQRLLATEESRVQEKAWSAFMEIIARGANRDLLLEWQQSLMDAKQPERRIQLLTEVTSRWQQKPELRPQAAIVEEMLVQAHLDQGKWRPAFGALRDLLASPGQEADVNTRLGWLQRIAEMAIKDGSRADALRAIQDARLYLDRLPARTAVFDALDRKAKTLPESR